MTHLVASILSLLLLVPAKQPVKTHVAGMHPFYVSVTEMEHNAAASSLEVSFKFFTDDFEQAVNKWGNTSADLLKDKGNFNKMAEGYIKKHFALAADGRPLQVNYLGYEVEKESVYCYVEVSNAPTIRQIDIDNRLLYNLTKDQVNIIHATVNGKRKSAKLGYPEARVRLSF